MVVSRAMTEQKLFNILPSLLSPHGITFTPIIGLLTGSLQNKRQIPVVVSSLGWCLDWTKTPSGLTPFICQQTEASCAQCAEMAMNLWLIADKGLSNQFLPPLSRTQPLPHLLCQLTFTLPNNVDDLPTGEFNYTSSFKHHQCDKYDTVHR